MVSLISNNSRWQQPLWVSGFRLKILIEITSYWNKICILHLYAVRNIAVKKLFVTITILLTKPVADAVLLLHFYASKPSQVITYSHTLGPGERERVHFHLIRRKARGERRFSARQPAINTHCARNKFSQTFHNLFLPRKHYWNTSHPRFAFSGVQQAALWHCGPNAARLLFRT